ncbi:MAG: UDP-2,3-diacylglucosamine diphosphatase [Deltaproteobacteria bacterium]|nr:UDP-2,3-diacylglucosamine diphosphatase [Candidatus Anaeroferrophillus wilburensis]MBN2889892.1 UDP-2,3-diacylglucosamine diphosphatase [Deltaproteobacteria bacterium]
MKSIFIADAHLKHPADKNYRKMVAFLSNLPHDVDNLIILGDFFDFWFGYHDVVYADYVPILATLETLVERGIRLYFVEGNHEINLGPYFCNHLRTHSNPRQLSLSIDGQRLYLAHGDLLNDDQWLYLKWHKLLKSQLITRIIHLIPPSVTRRLARRLSAGSRKRGRQAHGIPATLTAKLQKILQVGYDAAIIAHYHQPLEQRTTVNGRQCPIFFLGDWLTDYSYLLLENGTFELKTAS